MQPEILPEQSNVQLPEAQSTPQEQVVVALVTMFTLLLYSAHTLDATRSIETKPAIRHRFHMILISPSILLMADLKIHSEFLPRIFTTIHYPSVAVFKINHSYYENHIASTTSEPHLF